MSKVQAILVAQCSRYESQELGVSDGHNIVVVERYDVLHDKMALAPSLRPLLIAGRPDAPHTLDVFRERTFQYSTTSSIDSNISRLCLPF